MPLRSYDPAIARWNRIDPVVHHSLSTYNGFDNNPIVYADPSGGDSDETLGAGQLFTLGDQGRMELRGDFAVNGIRNSSWRGPNTRSNRGRDYASAASAGLLAVKDNNSKATGLDKLDDAMRSLGFTPVTYVLTPIGKNKTKYIAYGEDLDMLEFGEFVQSYPGKIDFKNVTSKEEFLDHVIEWFGFVNKFGGKLNIHPGSVIDFYAEPKVKPSFGQKVTNFLEDIIGGDSEDHNHINIGDDNGNSVRIGYFKNTRDHADLYSANWIHFEGKYNPLNKYRISLRSHETGSGNPQAIIYMRFTGQNRQFYDQIARRINSYKYEGVNIIPYRKQ